MNRRTGFSKERRIVLRLKPSAGKSTCESKCFFLFKPQASIPYRNRDPKPEIPTRGISDVGRELTLIENLSFSNIVMDRIAWEPIHVRLDGDVPDIKAVRNLLFSGIRARGARFPMLLTAHLAKVKPYRFPKTNKKGQRPSYEPCPFVVWWFL